MRILLLNDDFPKETPNSVAMIVRDLATAYRARGHETHILTTHRPSQSREILRGDGVTSLPSGYRPSLRHWLSLWRPAMSRMVSQEIAHFRPDAVHAHNLHIHLTFDALRQARRHTAQVLLTLHDAMAFAEGRIATARYLDHEDPKLSFADRIAMVGLQYNPLRNPFIRRMINRNATKTVAVSAAVAQAAERHGLQDVGVVHNAVDLREWGAPEADAAAFREQHGLGARKLVLFAG